jgi:hypothetical protein
MFPKSFRQQEALRYVQNRVRIYKAILIGLALFAGNASAQTTTYTWDNSGNGLLKGTYYFRQTAWLVGQQDGSLGQAIAIYGNITFDGNGGYTTSAQIYDTNNNSGNGVSNLNISGTYTISASGYGFINSPLESGDAVYGLVSNGIFIGSSTENQIGYNDLMIAAPLGSPTPTLASLKGHYGRYGSRLYGLRGNERDQSEPGVAEVYLEQWWIQSSLRRRFYGFQRGFDAHYRRPLLVHVA